jgi:ATP-dependent Clp protease adaptor protein ClpS
LTGPSKGSRTLSYAHEGDSRELSGIGSLMTTAPDVTTTTREQDLTAILPPYSVILHNDDVNEMNYVVQSLLVCIPELDSGRAAEIMIEAHLNGKAQVITCPLERAELYRDRLQSRGLTATIEKA